MGENAKRISDRKVVKIGTCNDMWSIRFDQLGEVEYEYRTDDLMWRIPMPDEDGTKPGDYAYGLCHDNYIPWQLSIDIDKLDKTPVIANSGFFQMWEKRMGLTINVTCHHGLELPKSNESAQFFWNGKADVLHLAFLNNAPKELLIGVQCRMCKNRWVYSWNEIGDFIKSVWMRLRLFRQCNEYWFRLHPEEAGKPFVYSDERPSCFTHQFSMNRTVHVTSDGPDSYRLDCNGRTEVEGPWEKVRNEFIVRFMRGFEGRDMTERYIEGKK